MPNVFTSICQTIYEYASTTLATTTTYCYHSIEIYYGFGFELLFFCFGIFSAICIALYFTRKRE